MSQTLSLLEVFDHLYHGSSQLSVVLSASRDGLGCAVSLLDACEVHLAADCAEPVIKGT